MNFSGKATRAEYWWWQLWQVIFWIVWLIVFIIAAVTTASSGKVAADTSNPEQVLSALVTSGGILLIVLVLIAVLWGLATFLPGISLTIRRYRDAGLKTWAAWVLWVGTLFGGTANATNAGHDGVSIIVMFGGIFSLPAFIVTVLPSDQFTGVSGIGRDKNEQVAPVSDYVDTTEDEL